MPASSSIAGARQFSGLRRLSASASRLRQSLRLYIPRLPTAQRDQTLEEDVQFFEDIGSHRHTHTQRDRTLEEDYFDMISDWRSDISKIGAITRPSTSGAGSKPNLRRP